MDEKLRLLELALTCRVLREGPFSSDEYCAWNQRIVEASQGKNELLLDDSGFPSVMLRFPFTRSNALLDGADGAPHPAFVISGETLDVLC